MNWFERYGIVGMFFIVLTGIWFFCLFPEHSIALFNNTEKLSELITIIGGFCGLGFLPIGYMIVILGQRLYYREKYWHKIHCKYWEALSDTIKKKIKAQEKIHGETDLSEKDEAKLEAILTYYDRMYIKDTEKNTFLSSFATKRYDVVAINRGLILAIISTPFLAFFIGLFIFKFSWGELVESLKSGYPTILLALLVAYLVWIMLSNSCSILENQIIEIGKRKLRDIDFTDKEELQKN